MYSKNICNKDNDKPAYWVGRSKLISLDINDLIKRTPTFNKIQDSVTGNIKGEENAAENTTDDADENAEENEIIHKK